MKKNNSIFIIIFFTFVSLINMVSWYYYKIDSNHYEQTILLQIEATSNNKAYIQKKLDNSNKAEVVKKESLETDGLSQEKTKNDYKNEENANSKVISAKEDVKIDNKSTDSLENYYDYIGKEKSVFKVSTGKIEESLTTSDKIKLLFVSIQLGKEDYKKVKDYLYDVDAEDGVLKALNLLKEDLTDKEYEKIRVIAGKFIDMDAAEKLN
ncbi:MAG TPA: hypothetical protein VIM70_11670 [Clostridium sp.]|uniref:hypothetical protein n=1 Tax=Clostridium sp. TaxID=1506 RepID=UPI002F94B3F5